LLRHMHQDTFAMAFALAGKPRAFSQTQVAPGALMARCDACLRRKADNATGPGFMLVGMMQVGLGRVSDRRCLSDAVTVACSAPRLHVRLQL
jgi:hypothetical protein